MDADLLWPAGLTLLLAFGAFSDIRERRLPNWLSLALLVLGLAHAFSIGGFSAMGWHAAHMAIALAVGMALFAGNIIGGGDAKFYAGMAAFFPLSVGLNLVLTVTIIGGLAVMVWIVGRRILGAERLSRDNPGGKFPYGVAIAAGAMLVAWQAALAPPPGLA